MTVIPPRPQHVSGDRGLGERLERYRRCGTAGTSGDFTVTSHATTYTVDVGANSTSFKEKGVTAPSFAIVCTGDKVRASGADLDRPHVSSTDTIVILPSK